MSVPGGLCFQALTSSGDIPAPRRSRLAWVISATNAWAAASVVRPNRSVAGSMLWQAAWNMPPISARGRSRPATSVPSGSPTPRSGGKVHRQPLADPQVPASLLRDPVEDSLELLPSRQQRHDAHRPAVIVLYQHHPARPRPGVQLAHRGNRVSHMQQQQPRLHQVERAARRLAGGLGVSAGELELPPTVARSTSSASRPSRPSLSSPVTHPEAPTRPAISRMTSPGPQPASRHRMPGPMPTRPSTCAVTCSHSRARQRRRWYSSEVRPST